MKKGYVYTVLYMVALTAVLTLGLAAANEAFTPRIDNHARLREERAVLYVFDLERGLNDEEAHARFGQLIQEGSKNGLTCYILVQDSETTAYAFPFEGAGLWGSLRGYLGVDASLGKTTGLVFTFQSETPGLGGRIDEEGFKAQFRNLPIKEGVPLLYGKQAEDGLDAITGATQTSAAVLRTLNGLVERIFAGEEAVNDV